MARPFKSQNMMTEHLQSIRDLDLELELLKRKRELMEKQHQITNLRQNQYDYNQPERYQEQRYDRGAGASSDRNFANLYEDPSNYRDRPKPGAKKRLGYNSNNSWNETPPPKRSFGPPKGKFGGGPNPKSNKTFTPMGQQISSPVPLNPRANQRPPNQRPRQRTKRQSPGFSGQGSVSNSERFKSKPFIGQRIMEQKQSFLPKKDFTPTKVNKFKKNSTPFPHKDKLASEALKIQHEHETHPILLPDKVPTQQMAGRLELALGKIMKDIKEVYEGLNTYVSSFLPIGQRIMKQAIRERLRGVMLGKPVGHLSDIISFYRQTYPKETDIEIVKMGANQPSNDKQESIKAAGEYFKKNMYNLLHTRLDDIFQKVQTIYKEERAASRKVKALNKKPILDEKTDANEQIEAAEQPVSDKHPDSKDSLPSEEQPVANIQPDSNEHETSNKQEDQEISEKQESDEKQDLVGQEASEIQDTIENPKPEKIESSQITESNDVPMETMEIKDGDDNGTGQESKDVEDAKKKLGFDVYQLYDKLMDTFLSERLPRVLPKYKNLLIKTLDIDFMYEHKKVEIMRETKKIIQKGYGITQESHGGKTKSNKLMKSVNPDDDDSHKEKPRPAYAPLPYYVKIIGNPSLPKRHVMQGFLDQFHPKSIKKVKTLRNLLFAGFDSKENFDGIVAASGTVVGNDTITVRVSKWVTSNKNENANEGNDSTNEDSKSKSDSLINSDLDSQISDLLSAIRSEEEKKETEENETGDNKQDDDKMDTAEANASEETMEETEDANATEEAIEETDANASEEAIEETAEAYEETTEVNASEEAIRESKNEEGIEEMANEEEADDGSQKQDNAEEVNENNIPEKKDGEKSKLGAKESTATPTRASTRLASGTVRTRRTSRLAQN